MTGTDTDQIRSREKYGEVQGFARLASDEPVADGALIPVPESPPAMALEDICWLTQQDGSYLLPLPAGTYTIQVFADSPAGTPLFGEVTGVVVTAGQEARADIVVTERPAEPEQPRGRQR